ncbi:MAG: HAD-IG family 5'-nucleotidase [Deltaproteobacteria bacterium]|nr:HAD-IG family 5'-nucleotidase [Deltaproteobacteria bacterium]
MEGISTIGFDMDYTLAIYKQPEIDRLSVIATVDKLVVERGYPAELKELPFDCGFPIRGLLIDKDRGNILKMDRYKYVKSAYHGSVELPREERHLLYHQRVPRRDPPYYYVDTLYALPEAAMYAAIVPILEERGVEFSYERLFLDIRECIDASHRDGSILDVMLADLDRFVFRDPDLAPTLHKFRSAGKRLFLLTNSQWAYTDRMMTYLLGGAMPKYPTWRHYFDIIVVAARKPSFFTESAPLLERDGDRFEPATSLERGKIYEAGNLRDFERLAACSGDQILYIGDHIYGDILRSKKDSAWRTAMVIQEMEQEISVGTTVAAELARRDELEERRAQREDDLRFHQARWKALQRTDAASAPDAEASRARHKAAIEAARSELRQLTAEMHRLDRAIDGAFHPHWGPLFKAGPEVSRFGDQVEEYACLYTSRVSNFLRYSPLQYFRSPRDRMPHEM